MHIYIQSIDTNNLYISYIYMYKTYKLPIVYLSISMNIIYILYMYKPPSYYSFGTRSLYIIAHPCLIFLYLYSILNLLPTPTPERERENQDTVTPRIPQGERSTMTMVEGGGNPEPGTYKPGNIDCLVSFKQNTGNF